MLPSMRTHQRIAVLALLVGVSPLASCKGVQDLVGGSQASATSTASAPAAPTASAAPVAASDEVTFVKGVPKAGTKADAKTSMSVKFTYQGKVYRSTEEMAAEADVQASDEFRVTKAAIDVKQLFSTSQEGTGNEKKSVSPLAGSRFVVTRNDDGKLSALDSSGSKVAAALLTEIQKNFAAVFERDKSREFLPNRAVKVGEKLIPSADAVLGLLGMKDDGKTTVDGVEFILKSAAPDKATFAVSMTFTQKLDGGIRLRAKLDGTVDVRPKDSEISNISLKGPLTLLDAQGNDKGSGDLSFSGQVTSS
jgi:hypothetical protein